MRRCIKTGLDITFGNGGNVYRGDMYQLEPGLYECRINSKPYIQAGESAGADLKLIDTEVVVESEAIVVVRFYYDCIAAISQQLLDFFKEWEPEVYTWLNARG